MNGAFEIDCINTADRTVSVTLHVAQIAMVAHAIRRIQDDDGWTQPVHMAMFHQLMKCRDVLNSDAPAEILEEHGIGVEDESYYAETAA